MVYHRDKILPDEDAQVKGCIVCDSKLNSLFQGKYGCRIIIELFFGLILSCDMFLSNTYFFPIGFHEPFIRDSLALPKIVDEDEVVEDQERLLTQK